MSFFYNNDILKMINPMTKITKGGNILSGTTPLLNSLLSNALHDCYKNSPAQLVKGIESFHKSVGFNTDMAGMVEASKQMAKLYQSISGITDLNSPAQSIKGLESFHKSVGFNTDITGMVEASKQIAKLYQSISGLADLSTQMAVQNFAGILKQYNSAQMPNVISNLSKSLELLSRYYDKEDSQPENELDLLKENEAETYELEDDIQAIISDIVEDRNWQVSLNEKIESWKEKNPIYAKILAVIIPVVLTMMITFAIKSVISVAKDIVLRSSPSAKSEVTTVIPQGEQIILLSTEESYYYKIYYSDSTGNEYEGYVSKRMLNSVASSSNATASSH